MKSGVLRLDSISHYCTPFIKLKRLPLESKISRTFVSFTRSIIIPLPNGNSPVSRFYRVFVIIQAKLYISQITLDIHGFKDLGNLEEMVPASLTDAAVPAFTRKYQISISRSSTTRSILKQNFVEVERIVFVQVLRADYRYSNI